MRRSLLTGVAIGIGIAGWSQSWREQPAEQERRSGNLRSPITESSGVVRGRTNPNALWTLNDSGNDAVVFAVDTTGRLIAAVAVTGARNVDWEAISAGPCGQQSCLWIGDIGDNRGVRRSITIYRLPEPLLNSAPPASARLLDSLVIRYVDGPRDAESLVVNSASDATIITKGRDGHVRAYPVPAAAWRAGRVTVSSDWELPIRPSFLHRDLITDAGLSPGGTRLAVRSYRAISMFKPASPRAFSREPLVSCPIRGPEPIGEGLAWWDERTLVLTSERSLGRTAPIILLECDLH
jgi:hypothetical protein